MNFGLSTTISVPTGGATEFEVSLPLELRRQQIRDQTGFEIDPATLPYNLTLEFCFLGKRECTLIEHHQ